MRIHILTNYGLISYYFMYPLLVNKERLRKLSISIRYFDCINNNIYDCDALLLDSKYFRPLWSNRDSTLNLLQKIREKSKGVFWFDTTDSTGATHFQVIPYVDKYCKKQLLKDSTLYENEYYGARIYTDYYKKRFNLANEDVAHVEPLKKEFADKLHISWNLGLGPISANRTFSSLMSLIPWNLKDKMSFKYKLRSLIPATDRIKSVCFRGTKGYSNTALSFQRNKIIEKLRDFNVQTEPIRNNKYLNEMRNSKIGVSPFGAGEICYRDFEIVLAGAVLFKPLMSHLKTWPDIFIEDETYVSFKWDFSDFDEKLNSLLNHPDIMAKISAQAQKRYRYFLSESGQQEFCKKFEDLIKTN